jgi:CTP:molybdopterin cytidylyltransferase MocA
MVGPPGIERCAAVGSAQVPLDPTGDAASIRPVTVAAVILAASPQSALADADGVARVRRIADVAWSGGALPIVVVAPDPDGLVAAALAGAPVTLAAPAPPSGGPVAQITRGIEIAAGEVRETTAALVWPARVCWTGPETVTSLVEAHGVDPGTLLRPIYRGEAGWPVLLPLDSLASFRGLPTTAMPDELVEALLEGSLVPGRTLELGDPGTVIDGSTARADLPPYEGPGAPGPVHAHEWGDAVAGTSDDAPLEGPPVAPADPA